MEYSNTKTIFDDQTLWLDLEGLNSANQSLAISTHISRQDKILENHLAGFREGLHLLVEKCRQLIHLLPQEKESLEWVVAFALEFIDDSRTCDLHIQRRMKNIDRLISDLVSKAEEEAFADAKYRYSLLSVELELELQGGKDAIVKLKEELKQNESEMNVIRSALVHQSVEIEELKKQLIKEKSRKRGKETKEEDSETFKVKTELNFERDEKKKLRMEMSKQVIEIKQLRQELQRERERCTRMVPIELLEKQNEECQRTSDELKRERENGAELSRLLELERGKLLNIVDIVQNRPASHMSVDEERLVIDLTEEEMIVDVNNQPQSSSRFDKDVDQIGEKEIHNDKSSENIIDNDDIGGSEIDEEDNLLSEEEPIEIVSEDPPNLVDAALPNDIKAELEGLMTITTKIASNGQRFCRLPKSKLAVETSAKIISKLPRIIIFTMGLMKGGPGTKPTPVSIHLDLFLNTSVASYTYIVDKAAVKKGAVIDINVGWGNPTNVISRETTEIVLAGEGGAAKFRGTVHIVRSPTFNTKRIILGRRFLMRYVRAVKILRTDPVIKGYIYLVKDDLTMRHFFVEKTRFVDEKPPVEMLIPSNSK